MIARLTIEYVLTSIEGLGYELLSEYVRNNDKLTVKDKEGYYYSSFSNLRCNKKPNKFIKSNPYTIQNIKLWCKINNRSFKLVSNTYELNSKKLKWQCKLSSQIHNNKEIIIT